MQHKDGNYCDACVPTVIDINTCGGFISQHRICFVVVDCISAQIGLSMSHP